MLPPQNSADYFQDLAVPEETIWGNQLDAFYPISEQDEWQLLRAAHHATVKDRSVGLSNEYEVDIQPFTHSSQAVKL